MEKITELASRISPFKKKPEEVIRNTQRSLKRVIREIEREERQIDAEEKKLIVDIKRMAKEGQESAVKIMAQNLVRNRAYKQKFMVMKANIQGINVKLTTAKSMYSMTKALKETGHSLKAINKQMKLPALQKILMEFEKETYAMDLKEEMMTDAMDDVFESDVDDEDMDKVVNQVFDELGIEVNSKLISTGGVGATLDGGGSSKKKLTEKAEEKLPAATGINDDELEARLDRLKKT